MKISQKNKPPMNPNMTVNVKNPKLLELISTYMEEKNAKNLNDLLNEITKSRVLIPANQNEKKQPMPCLIKNKDGNAFLPIYTDKEQMEKAPKSMAIINMPYVAVNKMALGIKPQIGGIVINPFTSNLIFLPALMEKIEEIEKLKKEGKVPKTVKMTPQQYVQFERRQYEAGFLPKKLYEEGQSFIDRLCKEKEEYLDQLYEESYQQKRMYPYLPEEFSVIAMDISEELLVIRADMPARDMGPGAAIRVYITWNQKTGKGGYFRIVQGKEKNKVILDEVTSERRIVNHGEAPAEGAELQKVIELAADCMGPTS